MVVVGVRGAFFSLGVFVWSGMRGPSEAINCVRVVNSGLPAKYSLMHDLYASSWRRGGGGGNSVVS